MDVAMEEEPPPFVRVKRSRRVGKKPEPKLPRTQKTRYLILRYVIPRRDSRRGSRCGVSRFVTPSSRFSLRYSFVVYIMFRFPSSRGF